MVSDAQRSTTSSQQDRRRIPRPDRAIRALSRDHPRVSRLIGSKDFSADNQLPDCPVGLDTAQLHLRPAEGQPRREHIAQRSTPPLLVTYATLVLHQTHRQLAITSRCLTNTVSRSNIHKLATDNPGHAEGRDYPQYG